MKLRTIAHYFCLEGMGARSQDKIAEVNMHSLMSNCAVFFNVQNVVIFAQGAGADAKVTCCNAMFAQCFQTLRLNCLMNGTF